MFRKKKGDVIGLFYSGEDKKFSMTGVKDVNWEDPRDDLVGEMGRNHGKVNSIVFCVVFSGEPRKPLKKRMT